MVGLLILSKIRIARWKREGIYDEVHNCRMSDAEIAERKARLEKEAAEAAIVEKTEE